MACLNRLNVKKGNVPLIINIKNPVRSQIPEIITAVQSSIRSKEELDKVINLPECLTSNTELLVNHTLVTAVVTCDKTVRGVCVCEDSQIPDGCEITALFIADGFQGNGLGRKLLSHALREIRAKERRAAYLWVDENNTRAIVFFKKFGFFSNGKIRSNLNSAADSRELRFQIDI